MLFAIGDIVRIRLPEDTIDVERLYWPACYGQIGIISEFAKRVAIPAAKVIVLGEVGEFDLDELETVE